MGAVPLSLVDLTADAPSNPDATPGVGEVGEIIETRRRHATGPADWSFARSPKWILSHLFALTLIVAFVIAGFWQLSRLDDRRASNERVEDRALQDPVPFDALLGTPIEGDPGEAFDFVAVTVEGAFVDSELARVANRSQDGRGGDWSVALFETTSGQLLAVNRGFVLRSEGTVPAPEGMVELEGFLRRTRTKGWIGADDNPTTERMPRLNVEDLAVRAEAAGFDTDGRTTPVWLQLSSIDGAVPDAANEQGLSVDAAVVPRPVPLDDLGEGNHFSYAVQWFSMAALSILVYGLMLRRIARR